MENRLNFNLLLSLKEMALRRIGLTMCNKPSLFNKIAVINNGQYMFSPRSECHSDVISNLSNLQLPESLEKLMIPILKAECDEMARWKFFHEAYFGGHLCGDVMKKLSWTAAGTLNYQKTAEDLVRSSDQLQDVAFRFQLACFYCLEEYIPALWRELPEREKNTFYDEDITQIKEPHLQLFLPNILRRAASKSPLNTFLNFLAISPSSNSLELAACLGNKTLVDYYFVKLTKEVKEASLVRIARTVVRFRNTIECFRRSLDIERNLLSSVSCHLLSLMTAEEQNALFKALPCEVFSCFLDWPWQHLFSDITEVMWTFIPESKYEHILRALENGVVKQGCYYPNFFQKFFQDSPVDFKKLFVDNECMNDAFFWTFMLNEDAESIRVVLRNLHPSDRVRLVFSAAGIRLICHHQHRWTCMEVLLRELNLTKEEKQRLKEGVWEYGMRIARFRRTNEEFERFSDILDKQIQ